MFELLGAILLILLTMVSYSSGITLAAKRRDYPPSVLDLLVVAGLWLVVFQLRPQLVRLLLLAATVIIGVVVGFIVGKIRFARIDETMIIPESELPEHAREGDGTAVSRNVFRRGWHRWNDFAGRMGNVQGRFLMGFFYFVIVTPFGIVGRLFTDSLHIRQEPTGSTWTQKEALETTLEAGREQG